MCPIHIILQLYMHAFIGDLQLTVMMCKKLSALTTEVQVCTIKVKLIRMWESINNKTYELMRLDMILMDEKVNLQYNFVLGCFYHLYI
jgi:hypothetical protein